MSFLDGIFSKKPAAPAPAAPTPPGGPAMKQDIPANQSAHPNTMVENTGAPANPLDSFAAMFKPQVAPDGKPITVQRPDMSAPFLNAPAPDKIQEQAAAVDFLHGVNPEVLQKATSGDAAALAELVNTAARQAFTAGAQVSAGFADQSAREAAKRAEQGLDYHYRNLALREQTPENPLLQHDSVRPVFEGIKNVIANSNPKMTAKEVQKQAEAYFATFAGQFAGNQAQDQQRAEAAKSPKQDWSASLGLTKP